MKNKYKKFDIPFSNSEVPKIEFKLQTNGRGTISDAGKLQIYLDIPSVNLKFSKTEY